jgi:hypothetical protein
MKLSKHLRQAVIEYIPSKHYCFIAYANALSDAVSSLELYCFIVYANALSDYASSPEFYCFIAHANALSDDVSSLELYSVFVRVRFEIGQLPCQFQARWSIGDRKRGYEKTEMTKEMNKN